MPGLQSLSIRDLVALAIATSATLGDHAHGTVRAPADIIATAYAVADEFVEHSEGKWAEDAHAQHVKRAEQRPARKPRT